MLFGGSVALKQSRHGCSEVTCVFLTLLIGPLILILYYENTILDTPFEQCEEDIGYYRDGRHGIAIYGQPDVWGSFSVYHHVPPPPVSSSYITIFVEITTLELKDGLFSRRK